MAEEKVAAKAPKAKKVADPVAASIDGATQQMLKRAQELGYRFRHPELESALKDLLR